MAHGRIRRTARRGVAGAVLVWLAVAATSVLLAPSAAAAPSKAVTIDIRNLTPPVASVESGGTVTFVNRIPAQNKTGLSLPLLGGLSATVYTDVSVNFLGRPATLLPDQSTTYTFTAPATTGTITYTYRIVPQATLPLNLVNQLVDVVAALLPPLPAATPYIVQTVLPALPNLPSVGLPQLPQINLPAPGGQVQPPATPGGPAAPAPTTPAVPAAGAAPVSGIAGDVYAYNTELGAPRMTPSDIAAAAAFDPARYFVPGQSLGGTDRSGSGGGSGGVVGSYDGASVPVFGQLAGLDDIALEDSDVVSEAAATGQAPAQTLPAAALAAVVALAAVTAALVRTHQAVRASR